jgi:thiol-disulfide isomerase/thioredoxin
VLELGPPELTELLGARSAVVQFYAPWCDLCTAYEAEFAKAADAFAVAGSDVAFARVNVDEHRDFSSSMNIGNVPFVAVMRRGRWYTIRLGEVVPKPLQRYEGFLGAPPTIEWANSQLGTDVPFRAYVQELLSGTEVAQAVADRSRHVLVEFYASWCTHCKAFEKFYHDVGVKFVDRDDVLIARVDADMHREVALAYNVTGFPSFQLWPRSFKKHGLVFKGEKKPQNLVDFVESPEVYLVEAQVVDALESGRLQPLEQCADGELSECAHGIFHNASALATRRLWVEAFELLLQIQHTPQLRKTGIGSSPGMWNFLDNVKYNIETAHVAPEPLPQEPETFAEAMEILSKMSQNEDVDVDGPGEGGEDWWGFEDVTDETVRVDLANRFAERVQAVEECEATGSCPATREIEDETIESE